jgi:broad specificity phosphatase PhoE
MTRVYLVRHGQTDWNAADRVQGRADVPLNTVGTAGAARLGARLAHVRFDAIFSSPLARAHATATLVTGSTAPQIVPSFTEIDYGAWQGTTPADRWRDNRRLARRWDRAPDGVQFPDGESFDTFRHRVVAAWINVARTSGTVLVSAHGHVNRVILLHALGWGADRFWTVKQSNAGCTVIDLR